MRTYATGDKMRYLLLGLGCAVIIGLSSRFLLPHLTLSSEANTASPGTIVLKAEDHDGKDSVWERRHYYGKRTWGIEGSGKPESGSIWFDSFPGETGTYKITLHAVLERDGRAGFSLTAGSRTVYQGSFPYYRNSPDCKERGGPGIIDLGTQVVNKSERIVINGRSVYECGKQGAYALWYELHFEPVV